LTQISIFQTSFIWIETVPAILAGNLPASAPYGFLGEYGGYARSFDACQSGTLAAALKLPWDSPQGNFFWKYYFEGRHAGEMTGVQAWKKFVPFQSELAATTRTQGAEAKVTFDALYAPQGVAVIAQAKYRGAPKSTPDIAKLALAVRYDYRFVLDGSSSPAAGVSLDQVAERALALARERGFGKVDGFSGDNQPFSVTTFLVGEKADPVMEGSDEHFLLETVASWNRHLNTGDLVKLPVAGARLPIRDSDDQNMMYARKLGRAIWLPRSFAYNPPTPTLKCYHRNVTYASLLTLGLGEFISWVAAQHDAQVLVAPLIDDRAKRACSLLRLFSEGQTATGKKVIYRTASVVAQINSAGWSKAMALIGALP
jgi:hypothetical protein